MNDRDQQILHAAFTVFSKYGVGKTTMSDIAAEAGVARQTVYNAFPGKPEILRACVRKGISQAQDAVQEGWQAAEGLGAKIDCFFRHGPIHWYEMVHSSPELAELMDGMSTHAAAEMTEGALGWKAMFVALFEAEGVTPQDPEISCEDMAEFLFSTSINAKYNADTVDVLHARLRVIKAAVLSLAD